MPIGQNDFHMASESDVARPRCPMITRRPSPSDEPRAERSVATSMRSRPTSRSGAASARRIPSRGASKAIDAELAERRPAERAEAGAGAHEPRDRAGLAGRQGRTSPASKTDFVKVAKALQRPPRHQLRRVAGGRRARRRAQEGRHQPRSAAPTAASRLASTRPPSVDPSSSWLARSGCGIRPTTLRPLEHTPAMSSIDPLGLST